MEWKLQTPASYSLSTCIMFFLPQPPCLLASKNWRPQVVFFSSVLPYLSIHPCKLVCFPQSIQTCTLNSSYKSSSLTSYLPPGTTLFHPLRKEWLNVLKIHTFPSFSVEMLPRSGHLFSDYFVLRWSVVTSPCWWDRSVPLGEVRESGVTRGTNLGCPDHPWRPFWQLHWILAEARVNV